jgi:tol-pal system protein YbgF
MFKRVYGVILALLLASAVQAQQPTVEDIRADLQVLSQQMEELRAGLSANGSTTLSARDAASALVRIDEINADLRAALGRVEALEIKTQQVIDDGTRRIGDIEFRLSELEGVDASLIPPTSPLGGVESQNEVISSERQAFNAAKKALNEGDGAAAAEQLSAFLANFPDGPLTSEARYLQGEALSLQGDFQNAARAYLSGFSGAPDGSFAPRSLYGLSVSLFQLGQGEQACLTLAEIQIRYVDIDDALARDIIEQRGAMACP